jgi:hypothetical protein
VGCVQKWYNFALERRPLRYYLYAGGRKGGDTVVKVKTFTMPLKIFETVRELTKLDEQIDAFIKEKGIKKVISVSDTCTSDANGATIGIIRVVSYEEA